MIVNRWILPSNTMLHHRLSGNGKTRDEFTDKSHRPHRLQTKLSEHQEMLVVELRKLLLLPLDDLLVIVREFIHPEATRSGIHRTLRRHGVSNLNALLRAENEEEAQPAKRKTFKDYARAGIYFLCIFLEREQSPSFQICFSSFTDISLFLSF